MNDKNIKEKVAEGNGAHFKHTPGPWKVVLSDEIYDKSGTIIADCSYRDDIFTKDGCQANAERIVSCVNAMEGIQDPQTLRETWDAIQHLELDAYHKMKEERDKLHEALLTISKFVDNDFPPKVARGKRSKEYTDAWEKMHIALENEFIPDWGGPLLIRHHKEEEGGQP